MAPSHILSPLALALVAVYLAGITLFGMRFRRADRSLSSYFLAGRDIPWWAISLSIVAAETSTLTIISVPGIAYTGTWQFLQLVLGYLAGRVVVCVLFLPRYFRGELLTAYQLIGRRFGPRLHLLTSGLFLVLRAAAEGVRVFAVSIVVGIAIGTGSAVSIAIISVLTLLYTFEGGMPAVIWTDVLQMFLYIAGTLTAFFVLGHHVAGGWTAIHAHAASAGKLSIFHFAASLTETYTFWGAAVGGCFLTMASHGTDQLMVQRLLSARNLRDARTALLTSGLVVLLQFSLFLAIGTGLWLYYGAHAGIAPDHVFPRFVVDTLPSLPAGLIVAAILAAAMSNLSASINSLSSASLADFYLRWRPQASERTRTRLARILSVFWGLVLFVLALLSRGGGHVVEVGLSIASVAYGGMLGVFLLGTLSRRAHETGTMVGMVAGLGVNLLLWQQTAPITIDILGHVCTLPKVAWTWYVLFGSMVTVAVGWCASLIIGPRPQPAL